MGAFPGRGMGVALAWVLLAGVAGIAGDAAFPGAEGFGAKVKGGAGGKVIWVTNLRSRGPGSLREAIDTKGPRVVKFKVAGAIELYRDALKIGARFEEQFRKLRQAGRPLDRIENPYSFLTIDGAGAPPPGITISGHIDVGPFGLKEIILRNLRVRENGFIGRSSADCVSIYCNRVLVDHCSLQYGRDVTISVIPTFMHGADDVSIQWCLIGPGWGRHGYGVQLGGGNISLHHNLIANCSQRVPTINARGLRKWSKQTRPVDVRNNVAYNWHGNGRVPISDGADVNMVNNLYLAGPDTSARRPLIKLRMTRKAKDDKPVRLYLKGNITPRRTRNVANGRPVDEWADAGYGRREGKRYKVYFGPCDAGRRQDAPFPAPPVVTYSVGEAKDLVLSQAGAWPRDAVDAGVVRTVLRKSGHAAAKNVLPSDSTNARPVAKAGAAAGRKPLTVRFHGEGRDPDGKVAAYTWDFGDGLRGVGPDVAHTYAKPGDYTATLYVLDERGMTGTARLGVSVRRGGFACKPAPAPKPASPPPAAPSPWRPPTVRLGPPLKGPPSAKDWASAVSLKPFVDQRTWLLASDVPRDKRGIYFPADLEAKALRDRERLYVRVTWGDMPPWMPKRIKPIDTWSAPGRHAAIGCGDQKVTFYIAPRYGEQPFYTFIYGILGRRGDARRSERAWNPTPDWQVTSKLEGDRWQYTAAIPFRALGGAPKAGDAWGLKIIAEARKDVIYIWPPVGSGKRNAHLGRPSFCVPHSDDPSYYAKLRFE